MSQVRQLGLVLVSNQRQAWQVFAFAGICATVLALLLGLTAATPLGHVVVDDWHGATPALSRVVRMALLCLAPYPLLQALDRYLSGLLMRVRRTEIVSAAMLLGIGVGLAVVVVAVQSEAVRRQPILLPVLVTYAGIATNLLVLGAGAGRFVLPRLRDGSLRDSSARPDVGTETELSFLYLARFFWPLALTMAFQGLSRPLINLFISRELRGEEALAALAVVYSLAHLPYGWLNEVRSLPPVFGDSGAGASGAGDSGDNALARIRRFSGACGLLSFALMVAAFWIPAIRDLLLLELLALPPEVAIRCHAPLMLFTFFPLTVAPRGYLQGVALRDRRTAALAPSAPARIGAIIVMLGLMPVFGVEGASRGVAALLSGFVVEALVMWWFVARRPGLPMAHRGT